MATIAIVTSPGLNIRNQPRADASRVTQVGNRALLTVLDRKEFGAHVWLKVRTADGREGWCDASFVSIQPPILDEDSHGDMSAVGYIAAIGTAIALVIVGIVWLAS